MLSAKSAQRSLMLFSNNRNKLLILSVEHSSNAYLVTVLHFVRDASDQI